MHKGSFKTYKQKYLIGTFCLKTFGHEIYMWREAMAAYQFYLETIRSKTKPDSFDGLMRDLMSVFVLD